MSIGTRTIDKCIETLKNKSIGSKEYFKEKLDKEYEIYFEGVIVKSKFEGNKKYLAFYLLKNNEEYFFKQFKLTRGFREVEGISLSEIIEFKKELIEKINLFEPVLLNFFDKSRVGVDGLKETKNKGVIDIYNELKIKEISILEENTKVLDNYGSGTLNKYGGFKKLSESALKELEVLIDSNFDNLIHILKPKVVNSRGRSLGPFDSYKENKIKELIGASEFVTVSHNKYIVKTGLANSKFNMYYTEEKGEKQYELKKHFLKEFEINEKFNSLDQIRNRINVSSFIDEDGDIILMSYSGLSTFYDRSVNDWSLLTEKDGNYYLNRNSKETIVGSFNTEKNEIGYRLYPFFLDLFEDKRIASKNDLQKIFGNSPLYNTILLEKPTLFNSLKENKLNNLCHGIGEDTKSYLIHLEYITLDEKDLTEKRIIELKDSYQTITASLGEEGGIFWGKRKDSKIYDVYYFHHTNKYHYKNNKTNKANTVLTFLTSSRKAIESRKFFQNASDFRRSKLGYYKYEIENEKGENIDLVQLYLSAQIDY